MTAEKDNLDHELMSLVAMPTKLAEITGAIAVERGADAAAPGSGGGHSSSGDGLFGELSARGVWQMEVAGAALREELVTGAGGYDPSAPEGLGAAALPMAPLSPAGDGPGEVAVASTDFTRTLHSVGALVHQMFGADTLKEAFDRERSAILGARLRLLVERREMVGASDGLPTRANHYKHDHYRRSRESRDRSRDRSPTLGQSQRNSAASL